MDFLHILIHELTGIVPKVDMAFMGKETTIQNIAFEEQRAAASVLIELVYDTAAVWAGQSTVRLVNFPKSKAAI